MTSVYNKIGIGDSPAEKLENVVISLHKRDKGSTVSFPGIFSVLAPRA